MVEFSTMIGIVMGISQLLKKRGLDPRVIPIFNVLLGTGISLLYSNDFDFLESIQQGLIIGLSASGVYDVCVSFKKYE